MIKMQLERYLQTTDIIDWQHRAVFMLARQLASTGHGSA